MREPGCEPAEKTMNMTGIDAAGSGYGDDHVFVASSFGNASIEIISTGVNWCMSGDIPLCSLTDKYEWHVVGTYHIDR